MEPDERDFDAMNIELLTAERDAARAQAEFHEGQAAQVLEILVSQGARLSAHRDAARAQVADLQRRNDYLAVGNSDWLCRMQRAEARAEVANARAADAEAALKHMRRNGVLVQMDGLCSHLREWDSWQGWEPADNPVEAAESFYGNLAHCLGRWGLRDLAASDPDPEGNERMPVDTFLQMMWQANREQEELVADAPGGNEVCKDCLPEGATECKSQPEREAELDAV